jgi:hypothetical protein
MHDCRHTLPQLRWLGLRAAWLAEVEADQLHALTERDQGLIKGLLAWLDTTATTAATASTGGPLRQQLAHWARELCVMRDTGFKADIEALYSVVGLGGFTKLVADAVLQRNYL